MALRKRTTIIILLILFITSSLIAWRIFGSNTNFNEDKKSFYIKTGSSFNDVLTGLKEQNILKNTGTFKLIAERLHYDNNVRPGRYVITKGASIYTVVKLLRSGRQTPMNFVITKIRTKEELAQKIANNFECDSASFIGLLNNMPFLLNYGLDTNTAITAIIPNTYSILWNTPGERIFKKLNAARERFWTPERKEKAASLKLTPEQAYTLASIVEEESNKDEDKGKIASVYLNRMQNGMKLAADPTVIFALKDFSIRRVYKKYTEVVSPYNTYLFPGLPPGPICTPSIKTIDEVLNAPVTNFLYFVAQPNLTGYSNFATTYQEHQEYAKQYQQWLTAYLKTKQAQ